MKISSEPYGVTPAGDQALVFSLSNHRMDVKITNYGAIITALYVPDRNGRLDDVVLGHNSLEGYVKRSRYFGALIGRHANRIARGRFVLNGIKYRLATNNGANHLHGGLIGFDKVVWTAEESGGALQLSYISKDGEEGYPGTVRAKVNYAVTEANELRIEYFATTDRDTIINLTNHSYFNLAGTGNVLDHELTINADAFTPVDEFLIPSGEIRSVKDTPMDFTAATAIGARIDHDDEQLRNVGGYDHNFVLRQPGGTCRSAATLYEPQTGRMLEVLTTQPGMQFYSGNFLDGSIVGKHDRVYLKHSGCCLEPQHFPDSPNHTNFPSAVLRPGEQYHHTTIYKFSAE